MLSLIISIATLVTDVYPQVIPGNTDHLERANAGNVESQMFLADYYCEIGEYEEAIYWYRIASVSNDDYKYFACNNLAYLYAKGFGLSENETKEAHRFETALLLFEQANKFDQIAKDNILLLLNTCSEDDFANVDYECRLEQYRTESFVEEVSSAYLEISRGAVFWKDGKKYVGGQYVNTADGAGRYVYQVYTYKDNSTISDYRFIDLDEINAMLEQC